MNLRPSGYEPDELPGCSTPRRWLELVWRFGFCGRRAGVAVLCCRLCRFRMWHWGWVVRSGLGLPGRPGGDLLSHVLRRSTIGAEGFHGRVRDGIGCLTPRHDHQVVEEAPCRLSRVRPSSCVTEFVCDEVPAGRWRCRRGPWRSCREGLASGNPGLGALAAARWVGSSRTSD